MPITADSTIRADDFIEESERNATKTNDSDRAPKLESDGFLHNDFLRGKRTYDSYTAIDGSTTPKPVAVSGLGVISLANIYAGSLYSRGFNGFIVTDYDPTTVVIPGYLGSSVGSGTNSITAPAGNDRVIVLTLRAGATEPTAFTWNSISFVKVDSIVDYYAGQDLALWIAAIGNSGTDETFSLVTTGGSGTIDTIGCTYDKTDQTTPWSRDNKGNSGGGNVTFDINMPDGYGRYVACIAPSANSYVPGLPSTWTQRAQAAAECRAGDYDGTDIDEMSTGTSNFHQAAIVAALNSAETADSQEIIESGIVGGFSSLTIGGRYYISGTGTISLTGTGALIGEAISATEILMIKIPKRFLYAASISSATRIDCGFRASTIRAAAEPGTSTPGGVGVHSTGVWVNGEYAAVGFGTTANTSITSTSAIITYEDGSTRTATISSVDDTGFTITPSTTMGVYLEISEE